MSADGGAPPTSPAPPEDRADHVARVALDLAAVAADLQRGDFEDRLKVAVLRINRPATIVCVVGEFKQGKSSLINAVLGEDVCPVDDDLATAAITVVRFGDEVDVVVRRNDGDATVTEHVPVGELADWVTEQGNPGNRRQVERVELSVPNPFLRQGIVFVDTPGMGTIGAGHAAATLAFLPFADGLVFVSDASAELSAPELDFLARAAELCPAVIMALTKRDLYAEWERMVELDRAHLGRRGLDLPIVAVSAALRGVAVGRQDAELNRVSGIGALLDELSRSIFEPAREHAAVRAEADVVDVLAQLEPSVDAELAAGRDQERLVEIAATAAAAKERIDHLRGPASRWSTLVADRMTDLSSEVTYAFRSSIRRITKTTDDEVERLKTPEQWEKLGRDLQSQVADAVAAVFVQLERGAHTIRDAVVALLQEEAIDLPAGRVGGPSDVAALWSERSIEETERLSARAFSSVLTGLRGAQSGILMFGLMGRFLPTGAAAVLMSNPVTIGLGLGFASTQLIDARKRKLASRRQQARVGARQYLDDVQFEIGNQLGDAMRVLQRDMRDEFGSRINEVYRTWSDAQSHAQAAMQQTEQEAERRAAVLAGVADRMAAIRRALAAADEP